MAANERSKKKASRYERIKKILDRAAGKPEASYEGYGSFWNLPLEEFLVFTLYGYRMIAPKDDDHPPFAPPPPDVGGPAESAGDDDHACCHPPGQGGGHGGGGDQPPCAGRGARSWLVKALRGEFPFNHSHFPPLPWGENATRVASDDVLLIESWIDDCCPPDDHVEKPPDPKKPWQGICVDDAVKKTHPNEYRHRAGEPLLRQNAEYLDPETYCKLQYAYAQLKELNRYPQDRRSYNAWAHIHGDHCQHGWEEFLPWHRIYLYVFEQMLQDYVPGLALPYWEWTNPAYRQGQVPKGKQSAIIPWPWRCWLTDDALGNLRDGGQVPARIIKKLERARSDDPKKKAYNSTWELFFEVGLSWKNYVDYNRPVADQLVQVNPLWHPFRFPGMFYQSNPDAPPQPTSYRQAYELSKRRGRLQGAPIVIDEGNSLVGFHHHYPRREDIDQILEIDNWNDFGGGHIANQSFGILSQNPHNTGHIWLGGFNPAWDQAVGQGLIPTLGPTPLWLEPQFGDMLLDLVAVFDPMFWGHHSNVDRQWYRWQKKHPGVNPDDPTDVLMPFGYRVEQSYSAEKLGYTYAADAHLHTVPRRQVHKLKTEPVAAQPGLLQTRDLKAEIRFHNVKRSTLSYVVRVFLNLDDADAHTPVDNNDHYVGYFSRFGHGECVGGPGHCDPPPDRRQNYWREPRHHNEHHHYRIDATDAVRRLRDQGAEAFHLNVVVLDPSGRRLEGLVMDAVSLNFYD